ncbi:MAG: ribonuclease P protein component [Zoogloeaceae bacterium]|jgi:ribonuclease P protein component|nr:ribonuclease P protein component [Zoogloeaceae bacterium]
MVGAHAFPRRSRLTQAEEYTSVFGFRAVIHGEMFLLHYGPGRPAGTGARLGLVVGKKCLQRAVGRNLVKRIIREEFRRARAELPERDIIFRLRVKLPRAQRRKVAEEVRKLLCAVCRKLGPATRASDGKAAGHSNAPHGNAP